MDSLLNAATRPIIAAIANNQGLAASAAVSPLTATFAVVVIAAKAPVATVAPVVAAV